MNTTLCNMCMIEDSATARVLVQHRLPKATNPWCGLTFPGGHVEPDESVIDSVVREIREETGLTVSNVRMCGMVEWLTPGKPSKDAPAEVTVDSRYIVFLFRTDTFIGKLRDSAEGRNEWMTLDEMRRGRLAPHMGEYIRVILEDDAVEAFGYSGQDLEVLRGEKSVRARKASDTAASPDLLSGKRSRGVLRAGPDNGILFRAVFNDDPKRLVEFELPGDSTFARLHHTISDALRDVLGSREYEFQLSDNLRVLPHKGKNEYELSAQQRLWVHLHQGQRIDYAFRSCFNGRHLMTIEVLDVIPVRNRDEYPLVLNVSPGFRFFDGADE